MERKDKRNYREGQLTLKTFQKNIWKHIIIRSFLNSIHIWRNFKSCNEKRQCAVSFGKLLYLVLWRCRKPKAKEVISLRGEPTNIAFLNGDVVKLLSKSWSFIHGSVLFSNMFMEAAYWCICWLEQRWIIMQSEENKRLWVSRSKENNYFISKQNSGNISEDRAGRKKELWDGKTCSEMLSAGWREFTAAVVTYARAVQDLSIVLPSEHVHLRLAKCSSMQWKGTEILLSFDGFWGK